MLSFLSVVSQMCMGNGKVTKADLILLLYDGKCLRSYNQKNPVAFLQNTLSDSFLQAQ